MSTISYLPPGAAGFEVNEYVPVELISYIACERGSGLDLDPVVHLPIYPSASDLALIGGAP